MYDCAIIGSGPAGMEAAITLKIRNKSFILIGSKNSSDKVYKAHEVKNYLGLPNISGEDFSKAFLNHLKEMDIEITEDRIAQVYDMGDYYALRGSSDNMYEAKSIIIATGVAQAKPYKGEDDLLGNGVSYCATCDGMLYKNKSVAVVIDSEEELGEVDYLSEITSDITLFPLYKNDLKDYKNVKISNEKILELSTNNNKRVVITENNSYNVDGIFILRKQVPATYLIYGIEMDGSHIKVDRLMSTNLRGVFACGDIVGLPYQYIKAAGEGNVAALSVVKYLGGTKNED